VSKLTLESSAGKPPCPGAISKKLLKVLKKRERRLPKFTTYRFNGGITCGATMNASPRSLQTCIEAVLQEFRAALETGDRPRQVDLLEQLKVYAAVLEHLGEQPACTWIVETLETLICTDAELMGVRQGAPPLELAQS
jgi:hypothetical protein